MRDWHGACFRLAVQFLSRSDQSIFWESEMTKLNKLSLALAVAAAAVVSAPASAISFSAGDFKFNFDNYDAGTTGYWRAGFSAGRGFGETAWLMVFSRGNSASLSAGADRRL